jgi:hypothetical protein
MEEFWKVAVGICGLGAVVSFVICTVYCGWLKLPIPWVAPTKKQQFILLLAVLSFTFAFGIAGLVTYAATTTKPSNHELAETWKDCMKRGDLVLAHQQAAAETEQERAEIALFQNMFHMLSEESIDALEKQQPLRAYELRKELIHQVETPPIKFDSYVQGALHDCTDNINPFAFDGVKPLQLDDLTLPSSQQDSTGGVFR